MFEYLKGLFAKDLPQQIPSTTKEETMNAFLTLSKEDIIKACLEYITREGANPIAKDASLEVDDNDEIVFQVAVQFTKPGCVDRDR